MIGSMGIPPSRATNPSRLGPLSRSGHLKPLEVHLLVTIVLQLLHITLAQAGRPGLLHLHQHHPAINVWSFPKRQTKPNALLTGAHQCHGSKHRHHAR